MKDSYSLDVDQEGLDFAFRRHFEAYRRIFSRCDLDALAVEASSGSMGGSESVEFMLPSPAGEDWIASCASCGHAGNLEKITSQLPPVEDGPGLEAPERFPTPGLRSIQDIANFEHGAAADRQIKTLVYVLDGSLVRVLLRGDHDLMEQKLLDATGASELRAASDDEIRAALGALPGSLGPVGIEGLRILADSGLQGRRDMVAGANLDDFHLRGVDVERDIVSPEWLDLREVRAGEGCPMCDAPLAVVQTIEIGHIFKLGTRYSEALGAKVLDDSGVSRPIVMGSYGIGIERTMASVVERHHDDNGIIWPVEIAPFEVVITVLNPKDVATLEAGNALYEALLAQGIDTILDDRDERPGVKFKDAELVGIPFRVTVGPKGLARGILEFQPREGGAGREIEILKASVTIAEAVLERRTQH